MTPLRQSFHLGTDLITRCPDAQIRFVVARGVRRAGTAPGPVGNPLAAGCREVSARFGVPVRAFDPKYLDGVVTIRFAGEGDRNDGRGEYGSPGVPEIGEPVYACDRTVLTRLQDPGVEETARITADAADAILALERIPGSPASAAPGSVSGATLLEAQWYLADLVRPYADEVLLAVIEAETPATRLAASEPGLSLGRR